MICHTITDPGHGLPFGRVYNHSSNNVWSLGGGRFLVGFNATFNDRAGVRPPWPPGLARDWHYYIAGPAGCEPFIVAPQDATNLLDGGTWARATRKVSTPYRERATGDLVIRLERTQLRDGVPLIPAQYYRFRDGVVVRDPDPEIPPGGTPTERFRLPFADGRLFVPAARHPSVHRAGNVGIVCRHGISPAPLWSLFFPGRDFVVSPEEVAVIRFSGQGDEFGASLTRYTVAAKPYAVAACVVGDDGLSACVLLVTPQSLNEAPAESDPKVVILDL